MAAVVSACYERSAAELVTEGKQHLARQDPHEAIRVLRQALERQSDLIEARIGLARAYLMLNMDGNAESQLISIMQLEQVSDTVLLETAWLYTRLEQHSAALEAMLRSRGTQAAQTVAGLCALRSGNYEKARGLLEQGGVFGRNEHALLGLAESYLALHKPADAQRVLSSLTPEHAITRDALYLLAQSQEQSGLLKAAMGTYGIILIDHPDEFEAQRRLVTLHILDGSFADVLAETDRLMKSCPKRPEGYFLRGLSLFLQEHYADSVMYLQQAVARQSTGEHHYLLGLSHYSLDEMEQALNSMHKALDLGFPPVAPRVLLAKIHLRKRRYGPAIAESERILMIDGDNAFAVAVIANGLSAERTSDTADRLEALFEEELDVSLRQLRSRLLQDVSAQLPRTQDKDSEMKWRT